MSTPSWMKGPPEAILLATDLSARCDRAMDRAASLSLQWQARLVVLHVLEGEADQLPHSSLPSWRRPPDPINIVRQQLIADVGVVNEKATVLMEQGLPPDVILRTAAAAGCDLIVTGIARDELVGRFVLGRTVDHLLRRSREPVLVVKDRARRPYRHIVVATDFSESSRHALDAAARYFKGQQLTLFHAYDAPLAGITSDPASYRRDYREAVVQDCQAFLQGIQKPRDAWKDPEIFIEDGDPVGLLHDYVRDKGADLVVLGTHGRSALFEVLLGSVAKRIMDNLPCDALVVREPRAMVEA
jgi:nucleotide-binding universal stress UspA family protein